MADGIFKGVVYSRRDIRIYTQSVCFVLGVVSGFVVQQSGMLIRFLREVFKIRSVGTVVFVLGYLVVKIELGFEFISAFFLIVIYRFGRSFFGFVIKWRRVCGLVGFSLELRGFVDKISRFFFFRVNQEFLGRVFQFFSSGRFRLCFVVCMG